MKNIKHTGLLISFVLLCISTGAQGWQAVISSGYATSSFDVFGHEYFRLEGSRYSRLNLEYMVDKTFGLTCSYSRQGTRLTILVDSAGRNTNVERFELGFTTRKWIVENKFEWITGIGFGACKLFNELHEKNALKFATSFSAGFNYHISKFIGIRLEGRLLQFYSDAMGSNNINYRPGISEKGTVVSQGAITGGLLFSIDR